KWRDAGSRIGGVFQDVVLEREPVGRIVDGEFLVDVLPEPAGLEFVAAEGAVQKIRRVAGQRELLIRQILPVVAVVHDREKTGTGQSPSREHRTGVDVS